MSSFVISKVNYVRVAGLCAGISYRSSYRNNRFLIWDARRCNVMGADGFRDNFSECYALNVDSVCKQYGDDNPENYLDECEYDKDFDTYYRIGVKCVDDPELLDTVIHELVFFSRSVNYQIEDAVDAQIVNEWFNSVIVTLMAYADREDRESWGEFDLSKIVKKTA